MTVRWTVRAANDRSRVARQESNPVSSSKENDKFQQKLVVFSFIRLTASCIASQFYCASHSVIRFASLLRIK